MSNKKRIILTLLILLPIVLTAGLLVAAAMTEIFALSVIAHIIIKAALAAICLSLIYKAFKDQIKAHMKHALLSCGAALLVDMVVLSTIRYVLSGGVQTILFCPVSIPLCFTALIYYACEDSEGHKSSKKWAFIIGIPLTLVAVVFEVISFLG